MVVEVRVSAGKGGWLKWNRGRGGEWIWRWWWRRRGWGRGWVAGEGMGGVVGVGIDREVGWWMPVGVQVEWGGWEYAVRDVGGLGGS